MQSVDALKPYLMVHNYLLAKELGRMKAVSQQSRILLRGASRLLAIYETVLSGKSLNDRTLTPKRNAFLMRV